MIVGEATNGQEGFEQYMSLKPDIVTMDITMPVMTGVEALKKIIEADSNAKVVMVSAAGQQHNMLEAVQSGAADFISKPFDVDTIKNMVKKIVG